MKLINANNINLNILNRPVIDQNFYYAGLKLTSPTFSCAMSNMLPAMTFVIAVLCRYINNLNIFLEFFI
jgi:drug/metabolite transporter (DMT)-like permease